METLPRKAKTTRMSADAYAGFLKLLLTPASKVPPLSPDVIAYLDYVNEQEPFSNTELRALGQLLDQDQAA